MWPGWPKPKDITRSHQSVDRPSTDKGIGLAERKFFGILQVERKGCLLANIWSDSHFHILPQ